MAELSRHRPPTPENLLPHQSNTDPRWPVWSRRDRREMKTRARDKTSGECRDQHLWLWTHTQQSQQTRALDPMLFQCWPNIEATFGQVLVFPGIEVGRRPDTVVYWVEPVLVWPDPLVQTVTRRWPKAVLMLAYVEDGGLALKRHRVNVSSMLDSGVQSVLPDIPDVSQ